MLQRIQTVYFALAIIFISVPFLGLDFATVYFDQDQMSIESFSIYGKVKGQMWNESNDFWGLQLVLIIMLVFVIASFKNRNRQIFVGWVAFALTLFSSAWFILGAYVKSISCTACGTSSFTIQIGTYLFTLSALFIFLGVKGVRKDKMLVDSLNRLR